MLEQMEFFTRAIGKLRYFHPIDAFTSDNVDRLSVVAIQKILDGQSFQMVWNELIDPLLVEEFTKSYDDSVLWQHLGVETDHPFWKNRVKQFHSVKTNRPYDSLIPLQKVSQELFGNYKDKILKLTFEGNSNPFIYGLNLNAELFEMQKEGDFYTTDQETYALYIGFELFDLQHQIQTFSIMDETGKEYISEKNFCEFENPFHGEWSLDSACFEWDKENRVLNRISKTFIPNQMIPLLPDLSQTLKIKISEDHTVEFPLILSSEKAKINETQSSFFEEIKNQANKVLENREGRIIKVLDVVKFWNIIHHFHPYQEQISDFEKALSQALQGAIDDKDADDNICELAANMHDGHFMPKLRQMNLCSDFHLVEHQGKVFVGNHAEGNFAGSEGVEVIKLNGVDIQKAIKEQKKKVSSSPQKMNQLALFELLYGPEGEECQVELNNGDIKTGKYHLRFPPMPKFLPESEILEEGILYFNLRSFTYEDLLQEIQKHPEAKGLIFDNRHYPRGNHLILTHLMKSDHTSKEWMQLPYLSQPRDQFDKPADGYITGGWNMAPREPFFNIPTCLLIDQTSQSYSESWTGIYQSINPEGIIGRLTSGANGDINHFELPSGIVISFSGRKIVDHFGEVYFSKGIQPAILTEPVDKSKAPKFEKDPFISAALNYLKSK